MGQLAQIGQWNAGNDIAITIAVPKVKVTEHDTTLTLTSRMRPRGRPTP